MKNLKKLLALTLFSVVILLSSCKSKECMMPWPSRDIYFVIKKGDSIETNTSLLSKIRLYYFDKYGDTVFKPSYDTNYVYVAQNYFKSDPEFQNTGIMFLRYLAAVSATDKINNYYLQFPDGETDTIYLQAVKVSCEQGWKEACQCILPVRALKFNGTDPTIEEQFHLSNGQPVYVFKK